MDSKVNVSRSKNIVQILYLSHGGGPLPILGDETHKAMINFMLKLSVQLNKPDAILVISAHWEEGAATLLGSPKPPMLYDYYGFPEEASEIIHPAPGNPDLANRIARLFERNRIPATIN